jgi:predicted nucleic acid-binding protein
VEEPETGALQDLVRGRLLASSRVAVVEVTKAVARANPDADPLPVFALLAFVELDADLAHVAGATRGTSLRALDAIHVASALRLGDEVDGFVTYDGRQADAARAVGLHVHAPDPRQPS